MMVLQTDPYDITLNFIDFLYRVDAIPRSLHIEFYKVEMTDTIYTFIANTYVAAATTRRQQSKGKGKNTP